MKAGTAVLGIFLRVVEQALREHAPGDGEKARLGAVSFVHLFGSAPNEHLHFHCAAIDGMLEPEGVVDQLHDAARIFLLTVKAFPRIVPAVAPAEGPRPAEDSTRCRTTPVVRSRHFRSARIGSKPSTRCDTVTILLHCP